MSGPQCCANPPTLNPNSGAGHVEKLGGLDTYVTGSPDSKLAALLISDIFAKVAVQLAKREFIQAAVLLHPSFVTVDDIKGVEVPISVLGAEIDQVSPPALVKEFEEALTAKSEVDSFVKIFPKVAHGWSVRYNVEDESAVKAAEEAHQNLLEWLAKHVK
ncbi:hypothetical protein CUMW_128130 [Citrus unshiu]|uniref:Dienelactone hydrolase domain-containing protein n=1 Tax=Citrus unshiu TaxID=55188 RepID=A0A2H5PE39_CITUN|nr:hypothetical protein CUMW_128130 [Citrus unshiu]